MALVEIENSILSGEVIIPPSKSAAHRALICSFLAGGGKVTPIISSKDMKATVGALDALLKGEEKINCIESGSTLRFLIPVAAALGKTVTFVGEGRLPERPIGEYLELLPKHGVKCESMGGLPLKISGKLESGIYSIRGDVSSQYITGLLLALPLLDGNSEIHITTALESKPYIDMTISVMKYFGVLAEETDYGYFISGNQKYFKKDYTVEGDWSQVAFFMSAAAIGGNIKISGVDINSTQGDKEIVGVMKKFGADVEVKENAVFCKRKNLVGIDIDCRDIPDMVPSIAVTAAFADGKTIIRGAERLRIKESDRIESVVKNLKLLGADVAETKDGMVINGKRELYGANLNGYNDHRIVMAFSVLGAFAKGKTTINDAESINKSYPSFFDDYNRLGGKANVINLWK